MSLLKVEGISKTYSAHKALEDIDLEIPKGSIFGLLGPNGAGKTTLIRIITRIIEADKGHVLLDGEPITPSLVRRIGYLPEERGLYKKMKVGEQLIYLAQLKGMSRGEAVEKIKVWLKKLNLTEWWNKSIEDLSKGMAQKVQFIATVLHEPSLIILDEPFSGFDPVNADLIKNEILELRDNGMTVIFSTHRMESVEELCDHIALINKSRKILDGPKKQIKEDHREGIYSVDLKGKWTGNGVFEILSESETDDGYQHLKIKDSKVLGPNEIIKALIDKVEVHSFIEVVPSINDIFISRVKDQ